jgi:hypothetical protein
MDFAGGVLAMSAVDNPCSLTQTQKTEMVSGSVAKSIQSKVVTFLLSHNSITVMEKSVNYCWSCKM